MLFRPTNLEGPVLVEPDRIVDDRGYFARTFCADEFARAGLPTSFVQCSTSFNRHRGTLRGLHYQDMAYPESRLVRCTRGAIYDVVVDVGAGAARCRWFGVELSARNGLAMWIPPGFAHGFVTLSDETEVFYQMTEFYHPECARGFRWDDPAFAIDWPMKDPFVSSRDMVHPPFGA